MHISPTIIVYKFVLLLMNPTADSRNVLRLSRGSGEHIFFLLLCTRNNRSGKVVVYVWARRKSCDRLLCRCGCVSGTLVCMGIDRWLSSASAGWTLVFEMSVYIHFKLCIVYTVTAVRIRTSGSGSGGGGGCVLGVRWYRVDNRVGNTVFNTLTRYCWISSPIYLTSFLLPKN